MLRCSQCKEWKATSEFYRDSHNPHKYDYLCKKCKNAYVVQNRKKPEVAARRRERERTQKYWIKDRFGLTREQWESRLIAQEGLCACCFNLPNERGFYVDHDHTTGKIRGLVCQHCNTMLGMAQDDQERLRRGIEYLGGPELSPLIEQTSLLGNIEHLLGAACG